MAFRVIPAPHGLTVAPPRSRALGWLGAAVWNYGADLLIRGWFGALAAVVATFFLLLAVRAWCMYATFAFEQGTVRLRRPWFAFEKSLELPLAEVEDFVCRPEESGPDTRQIVSLVRTGAVTDDLSLPIDSFVVTSNVHKRPLWDGRASAAEVIALVERLRGLLDAARREPVGYRATSAGPALLEEEREAQSERLAQRR